MAEAVAVPTLDILQQAFMMGIDIYGLTNEGLAEIYRRDGYLFTGLRSIVSFIPGEALAGAVKFS